MALVLTMQPHDLITVGGEVAIKFVEFGKGNAIVLSFDAPKEISIVRDNAKRVGPAGRPITRTPANQETVCDSARDSD